MNASPPTVVPILATPFGVVPLPAAQALNPALTALFTVAHARRRGASAAESTLLSQPR